MGKGHYSDRRKLERYRGGRRENRDANKRERGGEKEKRGGGEQTEIDPSERKEKERGHGRRVE